VGHLSGEKKNNTPHSVGFSFKGVCTSGILLFLLQKKHIRHFIISFSQKTMSLLCSRTWLVTCGVLLKKNVYIL
jgi:hypothetical protein